MIWISILFSIDFLEEIVGCVETRQIWITQISFCRSWSALVQFHQEGYNGLSLKGRGGKCYKTMTGSRAAELPPCSAVLMLRVF
jgi:hypothetical protein